MKLLKSFSVFTLLKFFGAGVSFIVMPILTHYLTPKDYGLLSLINVYISILVPFISLNVLGILYIDYFNIKAIENYSNKFFTISLFPLVNFLFFLFLSLLFQKELSQFLEIPAFIMPIIPLVALLIIYNEHLLQFLIISKKTTIYVFVNLFKIIVETGLTIFFVIYLGYNWEGRIYSWLIVVGVLAFYAFLHFRKQGYLKLEKLDFDYAKKALFYGLPLIIHVLGKLVINQSDRLFISKMISVDELGVYNVGYTIGSVLAILSGAFLSVYTPYLFERLADINFKKKIEIIRLSYIYIAVLIIVLLLLTGASPFIFKYLIHVEFEGGIKYVFWISLSYVFWGVYLLFTGYLQFFKQSNLIGILAIINVILNLGLNYYCIGIFGAIGAAYATCISFLVITVLTMIISSWKYPMPWFNFKEILNVR